MFEERRMMDDFFADKVKKVGKKFGACSLISYLCKNFEGDGKTKISKNGRCI